jgi:hypothetical protein
MHPNLGVGIANTGRSKAGLQVQMIRKDFAPAGMAGSLS